MKTYTYLLLFLFFIITGNLLSQNAIIKGVVLDEKNTPVSEVNIATDDEGTQTNFDGFFSLEVPANQKLTLIFSHVTFKNIQVSVPALSPNSDFEINPVMKIDIEQIGEVVISRKKRMQIEGIITISPEAIRKIPGANAGVENLIKSLPGVNSNNELSTQYAVRGGNYDENLVYVNEIEVYRPFLVRSGQQEGLSFVNSNMIQNLDFSAGGFQAKYGDKLSSVLDITYKHPTQFGASANASFLGGSMSVEGILFKDKLSALLGVRYRNNSLFINSKDIETNANPNFTDIQTYLSYKVNSKLTIDFLGNFSLNNYNYTPKTRKTKFGTIANPLELIVYYNGQEKDKFKTVFGAFKGNYKVNENLTLKLTSSAYHTIEEEYYDILASYNLGEVNNDFGSEDFGEVEFSEGIGSQLNHARNDLDALIINSEISGSFKKNNHQLDFGLKFQNEDIRDRIKEWEVIDSVGFSVRPPRFISNNQPYEPFTGEIKPYQNISSQNNVTIDRLVWYAQYSKKAIHKLATSTSTAIICPNNTGLAPNTSSMAVWFAPPPIQLPATVDKPLQISSGPVPAYKSG